MGLFHKNPNEAYFAGGSKNVMESIQRQNDTGTLIELDPRQDFNTNSVITVAPNEQVIFIKNGEIYGILTNGRNEVKTENIAVLSRIRNMLTGGISTFTCQVYHVQTNYQNVNWGTQEPIQIEDHHLGDGVPTLIRGNGTFRIRFNINEEDDACVKTFMKLMGNKTTYTVTDLEIFFQSEISQEISTLIGQRLEERSKVRSINAISSQLKDFSKELKPYFDGMFADFGFELDNFSFNSLSIDDTEERRQWRDSLSAAKNIGYTPNYNQAVQQELLKDIAINPGAGGIASAGAGLGMGMAAGGAFAQMATTAFSNSQPQQPPQPQGFGGQGRFGTGGAPQQRPTPAQPDPMESLSKMKQMLDAGLIKQEQYDAKVAEIMSRL